MRIRTARLPIFIIDCNFFFASLTSCNRFRFSRVKSIADIVIHKFIFIMIIPVLVITLI